MAEEQAVIRKVLWRLIPFCMLCYLMNYIDRVNVSVAKLKMVYNETTHLGIPGFDDHAFNIGAGIFFVGYCLFELPSNLALEKFGARRWIARIMISWGIVTICMLFTRGPWSFYLLRLLLGAAEAGFFPGMILYFSYWVPQRHRAKTAALFLTSTAISGLFGNPLGGIIMYVTAHSPMGLQPWQWLFLIEGIPAILLGLVVFFYLTDKPADARWLSSADRKILAEVMAHEKAVHPGHGNSELKHAFSSPYTWLLSALYGLMIFGFYQVNFYTPSIIKQTLKVSGVVTSQTPDPLADLWTSLLSAIPFGAAAIGMILIGRHSDRKNERKRHVAFTCFLSLLGMTLAAFAPRLAPLLGGGNSGTILAIAGLSLGAVGSFGMFGPFWALPPQLLTGTAAAASVAIINSIGNFVGGWGGPALRDHVSSQNTLLLSAAMALTAMVMAWFTPIPRVVATTEVSEGVLTREKTAVSTQ